MSKNTYMEDIGAISPKAKLLPAYIAGFVLSLLFTGAAYYFAAHSLSKEHIVVTLIIGFAAIQFLVQLVCFLHLSIDREVGARQRLAILCFTLLIVGILVSGSVWIMFTLNQRMMLTPAQTMQYMNSQSGL